MKRFFKWLLSRKPKMLPPSHDFSAFAVGQTWRMRNGALMTIAEIDASNTDYFPIFGHCGELSELWSRYGGASFLSTLPHDFDLMELVSP